MFSCVTKRSATAPATSFAGSATPACAMCPMRTYLASEIINSDLMVLHDPGYFGGYSYQLKKMVDHQIQNVEPFFAKVAGETHQPEALPRYPDFLAIGGWSKPTRRQEPSSVTWPSAMPSFLCAHAVTGILLAGQARRSSAPGSPGLAG